MGGNIPSAVLLFFGRPLPRNLALLFRVSSADRDCCPGVLTSEWPPLCHPQLRRTLSNQAAYKRPGDRGMRQSFSGTTKRVLALVTAAAGLCFLAAVHRD